MKLTALPLVLPLVSGERTLDDVREIARHHRIQATPGYADAATALVERLRETGLRVEVEIVPGDGRTALAGMIMPLGWNCTSATAELHAADGTTPCADFEREPLSLVQRSVPVLGRWPVCAFAAGADGTRAEDYAGLDVRGRVVLTDGAVGRVHALAVRERGAAGILSDGRRLVPPARTREHDRDSLAYTSFWWGDETPTAGASCCRPRPASACASGSRRASTWSCRRASRRRSRRCRSRS
ncbi:MAG: hypothetical protein U0704_12365 [Candidatus Eisenbacteria bacterium]